MQKCSQNYRILTVIGGSLLHFVYGSIFLWGLLNEYIASYFRSQGELNLSLSYTAILFPLQMLSVAVGIPIGVVCVKHLGSARVITFLFSVAGSAMILISSYVKTFSMFLFFYGILFGFFTGCAYFIPIYVCMLNFPNQKGAILGFLVFTYSLSQGVLGYLFYKIVNPNNLAAQIFSSDQFYYFQGLTISVAENVPNGIRILSYIYFTLSVVGSSLIMEQERQIGYAEKKLKQQIEQNVTKRENLLKAMQQIASPPKRGMPQSLFNGMIKSTISIVDKSVELYKQKDELAQKKLILNNTLRKPKSPFNIFDQKREVQGFAHIQQHEKNQSNKFLSMAQMVRIEENRKKEIESELKDIEEQIEALHQKSKKRLSDVGDKNRHINQYLQDQQDNIDNLKNTLQKKYFSNIIQKEEFISQQMDLILQQELIIQKLALQGAPSVTLAISKSQFLNSALLSILVIGYPLYVNANIKEIAKNDNILSDDYPVIASIISSVVSACLRFIFSLLSEKVQFKNIVIILLIFVIISSLTIRFSQVTLIFVLNVILSDITLGGVLTVWPMFSVSLNGIIVGSQIFGIYWFGFSIANFIQYIFYYSLRVEIDSTVIFYIYAGIAFITLIYTYKCNFKYNWGEYYRNKSKEESQKKSYQQQLSLQQLATNVHTDYPVIQQQQICQNIQLKDLSINQLYNKAISFGTPDNYQNK